MLVAINKMKWVVYLLQCRDGSFYAGVTNNLKKRVETHNKGKGSAFTRTRRPCLTVWHEHHFNRSDAQKRESELKGWERKKKIALVASNSSPCSECSEL